MITSLFSVMIVVCIGYLYLTESPLNAVQLLWINLVVEVVAMLTLATISP